MGNWTLNVGYWTALVICCINCAAQGAFLLNVAIFWMSMLVVWQLSFVHSDLSAKDWYKKIFLGGAANIIEAPIDEKNDNPLDSISYEFLVPFYIKYITPWAVFNLLLLTDTFLAYMTGFVIVNFVLFMVTIILVPLTNASNENCKNSSKV